jgi:hypothetical protein
VPVPEVNVCPCCAVPEITGADTHDGATAPPEAAATTFVGADTADLDCLSLVAVTRTRIVEPTSAELNKYVCTVAPATEAQPFPLESQRCH